MRLRSPSSRHSIIKTALTLFSNMLTALSTLLAAVLLVVALPSTALASSIWHVTGEHTYYLFGTIHILKDDAYPLPDVYAQTLSQCDRLWVEVDTNEFTDPIIMQGIQQSMMLPANERIEDKLSIQAYSQLKELADKAGVQMSALSRFKPWAATNQLALMLFQQQGFNAEAGLDLFLQNAAQQQGTPVSAFETAQWQINMFEELSVNYSNAFIDFSTKDTHNPKQLVENMYQQWVSGDVEQLYQDAEFENFPEIESALLTERNNTWMNELQAQPAGNNECVAVGALHMAGPQGLLEQFRAAGYQVNQLAL